MGSPQDKKGGSPAPVALPAASRRLSPPGEARKDSLLLLFLEASPIPQGNREPPAREQKPPPVSTLGVPERSGQLPPGRHTHPARPCYFASTY